MNFHGLGWRAISVRQPWAWALVNGFKPIENRDWRSDYRGPLVIHASKTIGCVPSMFEDECIEVAELCELDQLPPDVRNHDGGGDRYGAADWLRDQVNVAMVSGANRLDM